MFKQLFPILVSALMLSFSACSKKKESAPQGKFVVFAKTLNILPKTTSLRQYRIEIEDVKKEGLLVDLSMSEPFEVEPFLNVCKENHYFEKPYLPKAFVIALSLDKRGELKEYGAVFDLKNFEYNMATKSLSFDATSAQDISPWILAKQSKLLSFEFFFEEEN